MRIALAQMDTTVGAFDANLEALDRAAREAADRGARLLLSPELAVTGYPPRDFLEHASFLADAAAALERFAASQLPAGLALLVGTVEPHRGRGAGLHNSAVLLEGGRVAGRTHKCLLPTYDVFDEGRYFDPGAAPGWFELDGVRVGVTICEDLWNDKIFWPRPRYPRDPLDELKEAGVQLVVNLSASPYAVGKPALRARVIGAAARRHALPVAMANLVGGNDSLVFDGHSLVFDARGTLVAEGPAFREALVVTDLEPCPRRAEEAAGSGATSPAADVRTAWEPPAAGADDPSRAPVSRGEASVILTPRASDLAGSQLEELYDALVLGTRDYARKTGFHTAVLGLSGGVDSALTAVIACAALGADRVTAVAMPSRFTASMSNEDAEILAGRLGMRLHQIPIERPFAAYLETLASVFEGRSADVAEENLQARIRGALLMALSNKFGHLVLTTGNKSELATGYCTLYGDMCGGLAVIGDVPKTVVYALGRHVNARHGAELVPERILTRPPSAELRENQTDQDSLPAYDVLDAVLRRYIEAREGPEEIARHEPAIPRAIIERIVGLVRRNEYKRRQAAPVLRVTARAFGDGWRFPIAHGVRP